MMELLRPSRVILLGGVFALGFLMGYVFRGTRPHAPQPPNALPAPQMTIRAGQLVAGFLDQVDNQPVVTVTDGGNVVVSGWAGCANRSSPAVKVEILVDGRPMATAGGSLPRPDVAAAFGRPDFGQSGWKASFAAEGLKPGAHPLTARVTCAGGETGTLPPFQLVVKSK